MQYQHTMLLRRSSRLVRLDVGPRVGAVVQRHALSTADSGGDRWRGGGGGGRRNEPVETPQEKELRELDERLADRFSGTKIELRPEMPQAPTTHIESWVPARNVSPELDQNLLQFRTQYFLTTQETQPFEARKVVLTVRVGRLGLGTDEQRRLLAVAGSRYNRPKDELRLVSTKYEEPHKNKALLRQQFLLLLADARENAAVHAATPDDQLPLIDRESPWCARPAQRPRQRGYVQKGPRR